MEDQNQHKSYQLHQTHLQFHHPSSTNVLVDNAVAETRDRDRELYEKHQFYAQQESGFQLRDLCSQLQTENCGPISDNERKRRCCSVGELCTPRVRRNASVRSGGNKARTDVGQIVEVQGGHIVRGAGGKDRHSKVCTAKGTRDRRVRLSANTAIEFYDVQDRLGFDRPSKAVDWLIQNAKAAIDELDHLPAWSPTSLSVSDVKRRRLGLSVGSENVYGASLLPPSLGPDSVKSFFPMGGEVSSITATQHQIEFQAYAHGGGSNGDCNSIRQSEDLRLSLQSLQAAHHRNGTTAHDEQQHSVFAGAVPVEFQNPNTGWAKSDSQPSLELGRLHKLLAGWQNQQSHNTSIDQHCHSDSGDEGGPTDAIGNSRLMFEQPPLLQPLFDDQYSQFFTQREPLQSSDMPLIRDWFSDPSITTTSDQHIQEISVHSQGLTGLGFPSGGFSGLQFPGRIQDEEEHDYDLKPAVLSSDSCH